MSVLRKARRVVALAGVPVALFIALAAWAFASPTGASPDDDYHLASIWCGMGIQEGLCEEGQNADERRIPGLLNEAPCYAYNAEESAKCQDKLTMDLLNTNRGNFDADYPPVYYGTMNLFATSDVDASVIVMRLVNAALFVGAITALYFMLAPSRRGSLVWGSLVTIVPLGVFLIPSQNPSSWAVISAATLWAALVGYWEATTRLSQWAFGALAAALTVMASGARADAAVYSAMTVVVTAMIAAPWKRPSLTKAILPAVLIVVAAAFFLSAGDSAIVVRDAASADTPLRTAVILTAVNLVNLPSLWAGALGTWGLGWLDTVMPSSVWFTMIGVFAAIVFVGLRTLDRRRGIAVITVFGSLIAVPLYILVSENITVGIGVQPRYIYPLMIVLAGIVTLGIRRPDLGFSRVQLRFVGTVVVIANAVALHSNIRRYVTGTDVRAINLDAGREWWWNVPFGANAVWAIGVLAFATAVGGILVAVRRGSAESVENPVAEPLPVL